jgi:putative transposase
VPCGADPPDPARSRHPRPQPRSLPHGRPLRADLLPRAPQIPGVARLGAPTAHTACVRERQAHARGGRASVGASHRAGGPAKTGGTVRERRAMAPARQARGLAARVACALGPRARARGRDRPQPPAPDAEARPADVWRLARRHRRDGYRRLPALWRRPGRPVHATRSSRIGPRAGLAWPRTRPRRHNGPTVGRPQRAVRPHHGCTDAVLCDRPASGPALTRLLVREADTRAKLASRVERRLTAGEVSETGAPRCAPRGAPASGRSDQGPELSARALQRGRAPRGTQTVSSAPGQPWAKGSAERVSGQWREEGLNEAVCRRSQDARVVLAGWRWAYHHRRPHRALGDQTPAARAVTSGCDSPSGRDNETPNGTAASQGHRLNFSLDQF